MSDAGLAARAHPDETCQQGPGKQGAIQGSQTGLGRSVGATSFQSCPNGTTRPAQKGELVVTEGEGWARGLWDQWLNGGQLTFDRSILQVSAGADFGVIPAIRRQT